MKRICIPCNETFGNDKTWELHLSSIHGLGRDLFP